MPALRLSYNQHWIVDVARLFNAFWYKANGPGPLLYYANLADPLEVTKTAMVVFQMCLGDFTIVRFSSKACLLYRLLEHLSVKGLSALDNLEQEQNSLHISAVHFSRTDE